MSKNYTSEHPKYKKLSETKRIKLAHHKGNGATSKDFMAIYNHFISVGLPLIYISEPTRPY